MHYLKSNPHPMENKGSIPRDNRNHGAGGVHLSRSTGVAYTWIHGVAASKPSKPNTQDSARTMLQHAQRHWPSAITTNLWPYAMNMAADLHNHLPAPGSEETPLEIYSSTKIAPATRHLGKSPNHARSVSLVLSLTTGMVSPQYQLALERSKEAPTNEQLQPAPPIEQPQTIAKEKRTQKAMKPRAETPAVQPSEPEKQTRSGRT
eukprot:CAMPEP_0172420440 /NCGR_PEP_ID=MMETSP1064-20121228/6807_1 /TAXON_ID=202472 /ORGANISM="Aulacoseira subarctica , Strain CCAP 1002/5" /LENGTH=204 /DNA_ID=CAMNT_0013160403 /DNA_START=104 /DNA_END=714 /DNA_ORIENTATION=-